MKKLFYKFAAHVFLSIGKKFVPIHYHEEELNKLEEIKNNEYSLLKEEMNKQKKLYEEERKELYNTNFLWSLIFEKVLPSTYRSNLTQKEQLDNLCKEYKIGKYNNSD